MPYPSLIELLDLELLDRDLYRGINEVPDNGMPTLFGGQVAAQALKAAGLTVSDDRHPHSLHGYFLRPGQRSLPVIYKVERDRDGRSFSARRVSAVQDGGVIFDMTASFQVDEPGGEYAPPLPEGVPRWDECPLEPFTHNFPLADGHIVPPTMTTDWGLEVSPTIWLKIREQLPDDRLVHSCALAYLSDIGTGFSAGVPGIPLGGPSLDHAMWLHTQIRADDWVLLHMWPLMASSARGLYAGSMHQHDGTLGAMITQEGLHRPGRRQPSYRPDV
jgi:acyl-CoA thioesterase-2